MIKWATSGQKGQSDEKAFQQALTLHDHDPALLFDEHGRLLRWVKDPPEYKPMVYSCCEKRHPTALQHDLVFVDKLEAFQNRLHDDLEVRTRAMKNWKKLRILIVLFKICGNKTVSSGKNAYF